MTNASASFTRMSSGAWGVRCNHTFAPSRGTVVTVAKRDGTTKKVTVDRAVWSGTDKRTGKPVHLCPIIEDRAGRPARRPADNRSAVARAAFDTCAECGDRRGVVECADSSGVVGMCCRRCAAQPAYSRSFC